MPPALESQRRPAPSQRRRRRPGPRPPPLPPCPAPLRPRPPPPLALAPAPCRARLRPRPLAPPPTAAARRCVSWPPRSWATRRPTWTSLPSSWVRGGAQQISWCHRCRHVCCAAAAGAGAAVLAAPRTCRQATLSSGSGAFLPPHWRCAHAGKARIVTSSPQAAPLLTTRRRSRRTSHTRRQGHGGHLHPAGHRVLLPRPARLHRGAHQAVPSGLGGACTAVVHSLAASPPGLAAFTAASGPPPWSR